MDFLKKLETLFSATARASLPRRRRRSPLDEQEEELLVEIRQALAGVEARERDLAGRLKLEQAKAEEAAQRGDRAEQRAHQQRAAELERHLEQEAIEAIDLEQKLAALEEKLALAKAAVDKQAQAAEALLEEQQTMAAAQGSQEPQISQAAPPASGPTGEIKEEFTGDEPDRAARKSRLSD